jgi:ELWxxDGT repeat protein
MAIAKKISRGFVWSRLEGFPYANHSYGNEMAIVLGNRLLFEAKDHDDPSHLWLTDGTIDGTGPISAAAGEATPFNPYELIAFKGGALFAADDPQHGRELWFTDGNRNGAQLVADLAPVGGFAPAWITAAGERAFFTSRESSIGELWSTDGSATGTRRVRAFPTMVSGFPLPEDSPYLADLTALGSSVVFTLSRSGSRELWGSDGTDAGTRLLCELTPSFVYPHNYDFPLQLIYSDPKVTNTGNLTFFINHETSTSYELWTSDGTPTGTRSLKVFAKHISEFYPYVPEVESISERAVLNNRLFFVADDGENGNELWTSDGTPEGTVPFKPFKDIITESGQGYNPNPLYLSVVGQTLYFTANSLKSRSYPPPWGFPGFWDSTARGLWVSDGSAAGTSLVISEDERVGFNPRPLTHDGTYLYFTTQQSLVDSGQGQEVKIIIWRTNGTTSGTVPLARALVGQNINYDYFNGITGGVVTGEKLIYQIQYPNILAAVPLASPGPLVVDPDQIQASSGLVLLQDQAGLYWVSRDSGPATSISWGGAPLRTTTLPDWQLLAAGVEDGANSLLWRHRSSGAIVTWRLDDSWTATSGSAPAAPDSPEARHAEARFHVDLNGDRVIGNNWATLARIGSTSLLVSGTTQRLAVAGPSGTPVDLSWGSTPVLHEDPRLIGWTALAAASIRGINTILWQQTASGRLTTWSFDAAWNATGGGPLVLRGSAEADALEAAFGFDADRDGVIGSTFAFLSAAGPVRLLRHNVSGSLAIASDDLNTIPLWWGDVPLRYNDQRLPGWTPLAAATAQGVNRLLWRYGPTGDLATWTFDSTWNPSSGTSPVSPTSPDSYGYEYWFDLDVNGDGIIGLINSTVATVGSVSLLRSHDGNRVSVAVNGSNPIELSWGGIPLSAPDPRLPGWTALAAASLNTGNTVLWRHGPTGLLTTWNCDDAWNPITGGAFVSGDAADADDLETSFEIDINHDGSIGADLTAIARVDDVALLRQGDGGRLVVADRTATVPLSWGGSALLAKDPRLTKWTALAAANISGINTLLWRSTSGEITTWSCDAMWTPIAGHAIVEESSVDGLTLETSFACDANRDGFIGEPISPVEQLRARILQHDPSANARNPFSHIVSGGTAPDLLLAPAGDNILITGLDLISGYSLPDGSVDLLDCGIASTRCTVLISNATNTNNYEGSGDSSYTLIRNFDSANDDIVLTFGFGPPITSASRTLTLDGTTVSGLGLHLDSNSNGLYDAGDNLFALLEGVSTNPQRILRI